MTNNTPKAFHMAPLQTLTVKPIVDPVERAALRESVKRSRMAAFTGSTDDGVPREPTLPLMLDLCRQLSADDRLVFATKLVAELSAERRSELKERLDGPTGWDGRHMMLLLVEWFIGAPFSAKGEVDSGLRWYGFHQGDTINN